MRYLLGLAVLTAAIFPLTARLLQDAKKEPVYTSKSGRFVAAFPSKPKEESQKLTIGKADLTLNTVSVEGNGFAYLVIWNDMPQSVKNSPARALLDGAVKGAANRGTVAEDKETTFGPAMYPARQVILDTEKGVRFRILIVLAGERLYQVMAGGTKEFSASPEAAAFLKSFELTK